MKLLIGSKYGRTGNNLILLANLYSEAIELTNVKVIHFGLPELGIAEHPQYGELDAWAQVQGDKWEVVKENLVEYQNKFAGMTILRILDTKFNWGEISKGREDLIQILRSTLDFSGTANARNVIHVRGGDVFTGSPLFRKNKIHPDYTALPLNYYSEILKEAHEPWTFLMEPNTPKWYRKLLRKSFPKNHFRIGGCVKSDFEFLLSSQRIALAVSTFSWSAAFLGSQEEIYFPSAGILSTQIRPDIDLHFRHRNVKIFEVEKHSWSGTRWEKNWLVSSKVELK
ncbi:alpha-1,2-fucosyltransferase [Candidatus Planktophila versatilis]|uniref:alpha-1,2-fucosyltransferase n=1 Tax=Candidatus Planktophila versatilis TaxID=1884905 RepID=UPI003CFB82B0